ncbi:hypothetical protein H072_2401 [Dactylellina haptotyla CBS 200.50]|uniref:Uncharacterized protein n=1 Tax=Dactylellina haptotyla (strain CBS 200.50) TaxID=1284197 RepID=S8AKZ3_DACHA|nr:hypothetical protein H072_2401 [Dactylellina haptotyla CBS 200.50]
MEDLLVFDSFPGIEDSIISTGKRKYQMKLRKVHLIDFLFLEDLLPLGPLDFCHLESLQEVRIVNCKIPLLEIIGFSTLVDKLELIRSSIDEQPDIIMETLPSLERLAITLPPQEEEQINMWHFRSASNLKSLWVEYQYIDKIRQFHPFFAPDMVISRREEDMIHAVSDFAHWPLLEELAITRTAASTGPSKLKLPTSLRRLCLIQDKREVEHPKECFGDKKARIKLCERLLKTYAREQMRQTGEMPRLEALAVGNEGISEAENGESVIVVAKHKMIGRNRLETISEVVDLRDIEELCPESHILGMKKGPWGWFRR